MLDFSIYLLYRAGSALVSALPLRLLFSLGKALGLIAWMLLWSYRRLAQRKDQLQARLKRAGSVRRLSVEDISGPDEKWWSRGTGPRGTS